MLIRSQDFSFLPAASPPLGHVCISCPGLIVNSPQLPRLRYSFRSPPLQMTHRVRSQKQPASLKTLQSSFWFLDPNDEQDLLPAKVWWVFFFVCFSGNNFFFLLFKDKEPPQQEGIQRGIMCKSSAGLCLWTLTALGLPNLIPQGEN